MRQNARKKTLLVLLTILLALTAAGCRTRVTVGTGAGQGDGTGAEKAGAASSLSSGTSDEPVIGEGEKGGPTVEDPRSEKREFDETASAEIVAGTDRELHGGGDGAGLSAWGGEGAPSAPKIDAQADKTATQTLPSQDAERMGASEDGEEAPSSLTYYTVLLRDRLGTLYECKRMNVYWETEEDHVTVSRDSAEHALIAESGSYDVSSRLLPENLLVDDGWIARKAPDVIVKAAPEGVLGHAVASPTAARALRAELIARPGWKEIPAVRQGRVLLVSREFLEAPHLRTALELLLAKTAYPSLFADVDVSAALAALTEEAAGTPAEGIWYVGGDQA